MSGADPHTDAHLAWKRERRTAIRRFHPDRGGSAADLMRALADVDQRHGHDPDVGPHDDPPVSVTRTRTYVLRLGVHRLRLLLDSMREHLPAHLPGSRRYTRL